MSHAGDGRERTGGATGSSRFVGLLALLGLASLALVAAVAVQPAPTGPEYFRTPTPHEAHERSLRRRGLAETDLGREWRREAERALERPLATDAPYVERGRFVRPEGDATGYRIGLERGQRLEVRVDGELVDEGRLLVDVFREAPSGDARPARVRSLPPGAGGIDLEPDRTGRFVVRLQPTLFGEGGYRLTLRVVPAFVFPVPDRGPGAVWSGFGAPREGGRRSHHGVDIFADRGTPAVAAADAVVREIEETPVGGKVVWLRDRRRHMALYYAHLDSQTVRDGQRVRAGDTVGLIGNTGNARTTPPHLHFGLYARSEGPIDPYPFIHPVPSEPRPIRADADRAGRWARPRADGVRLRARPSLRGEVLGELASDRPFRIVAATGGWYRVRLPGGSEGYVADRVTEAAGGTHLARVPDDDRSGGSGTGSEEAASGSSAARE